MTSTTRQRIRAVALGILVNAALAATRLVAGVVGDTHALVADGVESMADILVSLVVWGGLHVAAMPPDGDHPFGDSEAEARAAAVVSPTLLGPATGIAIEAIREIRTPHFLPAPWTLGGLVPVMLLEWGLSRRAAAPDLVRRILESSRDVVGTGGADPIRRPVRARPGPRRGAPRSLLARIVMASCLPTAPETIMDATSRTLFGQSEPEPATPGSYGQAPPGFRLPDSTRLGPVHLQVADLGRSLDFYRTTLGLRVIAQGDGRAALAAQGEDRALVVLREEPGARPAGKRGQLGLFHFAILLPDRPSLGRFVQHLGEIGAPAGAGDHLVSEAFYLTDPDGLGIEVYADRPRSTWRRLGRELMIATDPVDVPALLRAAGEIPWTGLPAGTVIGHVHLHVGDLARGAAFFSDALGFDRITWRYPGALFLGAGGYHHHLGTNTWAGAGAVSPSEADARLLEWTIELPHAAALAEVRQSLTTNGYQAEPAPEGTLVTRDPWGTPVRIRVAGAGHDQG